MANNQMLSLILVTVCVVIFSSLTLPVFCSYLKGDLSQNEREESDIDYFDDIGTFGLYPHDRFPFQMNGDENDPFNRYMDNVFDSLPDEAPTMFDALRISGAFPDSLDSLDDDDDDYDDNENDNDNDKKNNSPSTTTSKAPPSNDQRECTKGKKQDTTKSKVEKFGRKIIGKLRPIKAPTTPQTSTTSKSNVESDGDEESETYGNNEGDDSHDEKKWKSSTTPTSKSHGSPMFKWWSKMRSTSPKVTQKSATTELYEKLTTKKSSTSIEDGEKDDDNGDDSDKDLISSTTPLPNIQSSKSTKTLKSTFPHGKGKIGQLSTTNESGKSTTPSSSSTTHSTTKNTINNSITTESDFLDEPEDSIEKPSTSSSSKTTVRSTKRPKSTTTTPDSTSKTTEKDGNENVEVETIDPFLSGNVDSEFEHLKDPTTMSTSTKKHKHTKASTPSTSVMNSSWSTPDHDVKTTTSTTTADSDENSSKNPSTTQEPETASTIKSTTDSTINDPDTYPIIPVTTVKSKQSNTIRSTTTTSRPGPTAQGHKTSRHSTSTTQSITTTTIIPTLHPYIEDFGSEDDFFSSDWNPDLFP